MGKRVEYIELFWRCPECGQDHISAIPYLNSTGWYCPSCFFRRDDSVELYEAPDSQVITDPELIARIEEGRADWICKHCGSLNPDTNVPKEMLVCEVCNLWQTDETDQSAPKRDQSGEVLESRQEVIDRFENPCPPTLQKASRAATEDKRRIVSALLMAGTAVGIAWGGWWLLKADPVEVTVESLPWSVSVEVQQLRPVDKSGWDETVPADARILTSETRQRGTQEVQRGTKVIMVKEQYQSGTRTETYTEQERYQSGTREECTTTSTGTGAGKRTCHDVAVYSTRPVQRTRQVPEYSTRQVQKTVPNLVREPVYDTYVYYQVDEWLHKQTLTNTGFDNQPRIAPAVELDHSPYRERTLAPEISCYLTGAEPQGEESKIQTWEIPCHQFNSLDTGDRVRLQVKGARQATVKEFLSQ